MTIRGCIIPTPRKAIGIRLDRFPHYEYQKNRGHNDFVPYKVLKNHQNPPVRRVPMKNPAKITAPQTIMLTIK